MRKMVIIFIRNVQYLLSVNVCYCLTSTGTTQRRTLVITPVALRIQVTSQHGVKFAFMHTRRYRYGYTYLRSVQVQVYHLEKMGFKNVHLMLKS
jgi:hypothetical protein